MGIAVAIGIDGLDVDDPAVGAAAVGGAGGALGASGRRLAIGLAAIGAPAAGISSPGGVPATRDGEQRREAGDNQPMRCPAASRATALRRSLAPLALMGVIFWLSAQPDLGTGLGVWDLIGRKIVHALTYALLTALWLHALRPVTRRALLAAVAIAFLYAVSDEYHQTFVRGRSGTPLDVAIDTLGIAATALLARRSARPREGAARR